jgi:integrase
VRLVHGKELKNVPIAALSAKLWSEYQRLRLEQAGLPLDYSRRVTEAHSLNSAIRQAMSLVSRTSKVAYASHGIVLPSDAITVMQLPEPILTKTAANDEALVTAWRPLRDVDRPLWLALGLARFAGMRRDEIVNCRGKWIVTHEGVVSVELRDRPEDRYQTKTGRPYFAPILDAELASVLSSIEPEQFVVAPEGVSRTNWFIMTPQKWCRPYVSDVQKPLHRLRGLYAVDLRIRTRDAVAAALAGTKAASAALGHTSTEMTERHYLR